ncbi:class I SAM-dependent methyltransferase [Aspergillus stella-maris]|uniref:class I SAM-dependent methyltransferase n=1 Tax=Aspergillus stella-maris TaxID=1810926 RepID=UPI003CCDFBEA
MAEVDLTETNRKHFDTVATTHKTNFSDLINHTIQELRGRRHWISSRWTDTLASPDDEVRLLDYACGSGTVSKALAPYTTETVGMDLSENMVETYNQTAVEMSLPLEKMKGYQFDLLSGYNPAETPEYLKQGFDIIVIGMALHHVSNPPLLLRKFKEILKQGGAVIVLDMVPDQVPSLPATELEGLDAREVEVLKTIGKKGFTEDEMRGMYDDAGLGGGFEYVVIEEEFRFVLLGREISVGGFICRGGGF